MSVPRFGRVTPLQGDVLNLGGIACGVPEDLMQDSDRVTAMQEARDSLRKETGEDFGFDLSKWHEFLVTSPKFSEEYTFHFAWKSVCKAVEERISDPERLRLAALASQTASENH